MEFHAMDKQQLDAGAHWVELAPYLAGLNVGEALEDFGRLADRVLAAPSSESHINLHQVATFDEHRYRQLADSQPATIYSSSCSPTSSGSFYDSPQLSPNSPGSCHSIALPLWSQPSSPVTSELSLGSSSTSSSLDRRSCSSASSSASSSVYGGDLDDLNRHRHLSRRSPSSSGISKRSNRKRQNASAAGRYRQKQRGLQEILDEELELERQRQTRLMQSLEAKLELYREFANLLADNTRDPSQDLELARLGVSSLENILEHILPGQFLARHESQRRELERLREHFKRVLDFSQFTAGR